MAHRDVIERAKSTKKLVMRRKVGGMRGNGRERGGPSEAAVVLTETVTGVAEAPSVTGVGETVQLDSEGAPVQAKETVPPLPPRLRVYVANCPGETVAVVEDGEPCVQAKSIPVPLSGTVWGLPKPLSVSTSVPCRAPLAVGVNVTLTVQKVPTAKEFAQLLVWAKSPVVVMLCISSAAWLAVTVMERGGLVELTPTELNCSEVGDSTGGGVRPVPLREIRYGLPMAPATMVKVPDAGPV